ncbi:MAG TPA: aminotransferase class V-fold PLP-dependent enzyme [Gemmatimonadaceae bacterium]|nr:aminotransferase class V-fold PLP-dependent enzyme [Gemmatimonadaceae bacterium]
MLIDHTVHAEADAFAGDDTDSDDRIAAADDAWFTNWRSRELSRVERAGITYLDYTGTALHPESLVRDDAARLNAGVLGNPHSENAPSRASTDDVRSARAAILDFLRASPDEYAVVLTPNASGACRIVGESFPFGPRSVLALSADNHNSVNGIREFARRRSASVKVLALDDELRLRDASPLLERPLSAPSLLAFPAQSNFSGVRHPLALVAAAQDRGWRVLLDAASFLPSTNLRLDQVRPDFVALSIYKIAGYPTGIGALVARRSALAELRRPWFAGGTVHWVSVQEDRHRLGPGVEAFEDGTPPFLAAGAVARALAAVTIASRERLGRHLQALTAMTLRGLEQLVHSDGEPLVTVHGPRTVAGRGATIAVTLRDRAGRVIPYWEVEDTARNEGIAVRGGCFCNPGCAEAAFAFPAGYTTNCLDPMGDDFTIPRFAACLGDRPVGAIRISLGLGSVLADVTRVVEFLTRYTD